MNEDLVIQMYTRFAVQEHLLMQLYLQLAHTTRDPEGTLAELETRLKRVMASIPAPIDGIEDSVIKMIQAQRTDGPDLMGNFFRKVRENLPGS